VKRYPVCSDSSIASKKQQQLTKLTELVFDSCMPKDCRLQWKIAWFTFAKHFCTNLWRLVVTVIIVSLVSTMGVKIREYSRDYIPFVEVLKKNYRLQDDVVQVSQKLSDALAIVSLRDDFIEQLSQKLTLMEHNIQSANDEVQLFKAKVGTFEDLVKSMEIGKRKNQNVCQENVKLAVKLRESENEIRVLQEKLKEIELNNNAIPSNECQICLSHDMSKLHDMENEFRVLGKTNQVNKYAVTEFSDKVSGGKCVSDDTSKSYCSDETEKGHADCQELKSNVVDAPAVIEYRSNEFKPDERSIGYGAHDNGSNQSMSTGEHISFTSNDDSSSSSFSQESLDTRYVDVDDGIEYMSVAEGSMTRQYLFQQENGDESWFPMTEVVDEILRFVKYQSTRQEKYKCAKRRAKLKDILDELEFGVKNKRVKSEFLNDAFMRFYETEEGLS